jgi:hypothetical protein
LRVHDKPEKCISPEDPIWTRPELSPKRNTPIKINGVTEKRAQVMRALLATTLSACDGLLSSANATIPTTIHNKQARKISEFLKHK